MKRYVLVLLLVTMLVAAGCQEQERETGPSPYIGGTQGLALSFAPGMPPAEIYDEGQVEFSIGVQMENVGESGVGPGTPNEYGFIELIGLKPSDLNKASQQELTVDFQQAGLTLEPARRGFDGQIITGAPAIIEIPGLSYVSDNVGNQEVTLRANVCYEYRTYATGEICFKDSALENALDDTICTLSGSKPISTSGAPIQITELVQNPSGANKISVQFKIENLGGGAVYVPEDQVSSGRFSQLCAMNTGLNMLRDRLHVEVSGGDGLSDYDVRCSQLGGDNRGIILLAQGAPAVVSCTLEVLGQEGGRVYTDNLNIDLHYTYLEFIETPVVIRDTNAGFVERAEQ